MRLFHNIKLQVLDLDLILKNSESGLRPWMDMERGHESQSLESRDCPKDICPCPNCPKNPTPITHTFLRLRLNSENLGIRIEGRGFILSLRSGLGNFCRPLAYPLAIPYILNLYFKLFIIRIKANVKYICI